MMTYYDSGMPEPSLEMDDVMGEGTLLASFDTGADINARSVSLETTNPAQRFEAGASRATEIRENLVEPGAAPIAVRSGNQKPGEMDGNLSENFAWRKIGLSDTSAGTNWLLISAAAAGLGFLAYRLMR